MTMSDMLQLVGVLGYSDQVSSTRSVGMNLARRFNAGKAKQIGRVA